MSKAHARTQVCANLSGVRPFPIQLTWASSRACVHSPKIIETRSVARQVSFTLLLNIVWVVDTAVLLSTRGTAGPDIWFRSWSIGQWSEATSVGLCLKASKAESRLEDQRYRVRPASGWSPLECYMTRDLPRGLPGREYGPVQRELGSVSTTSLGRSPP